MPKPTPIPASAIIFGLSPSAVILYTVLEQEKLISHDVVFSLAQAVASNAGAKLSAEQVLLCVVSDYMAPAIKSGKPLSFPVPRLPVPRA